MTATATATSIVLPTPRAAIPLGLLVAAAICAPLLPAWRPAVEAAAALPWILCSQASGGGASARPASVVKVLSSEPLVGSPGKRVTVVLVHYVPGAFTPRHVHGGDVTAYVLRGTVRSEHAGLPAADYRAGETFHEPFRTTHVFIENPSANEPAEILAITVHDEGTPLTTFLD
jgi:quercetin dioxygenase-like cupin family protein